MVNQLSRIPRALGASLILALAASTAQAGSISGDIRFDGTVLGGDGESGWGMTEATALASGIPIFHEDDSNVYTTENFSFTRNLQSFTTDDPAHATSIWDVTNDTGNDLDGMLYLVFAKPVENGPDDDGVDNDYDPNDVGLTLRNGFGGELDWVIFEIDTVTDPVYYPAVALGPLGESETSDDFAVNYILENPQIFAGADGFELGIPKWELLAVFVPKVIPEPTTAGLLALGLAGLAGWRRRTS